MEGYAEHGEGNDSTEQIGFGGSRRRRRGRGLTTFGLKTIGGFFLFLSVAWCYAKWRRGVRCRCTLGCWCEGMSTRIAG